MWITFEWLLPTISGVFSLYRWLCASSDVLESDTRTFDACHSDQSRHREVTEQARQRVDCMVWFSGVCCKFYTTQLWNSFFWQQGGRAMHLPSQSRACSCTPILNAVLIPMPLQGWRFPHVAIRSSMSWQVMLHYCISVRVTVSVYVSHWIDLQQCMITDLQQCMWIDLQQCMWIDLHTEELRMPCTCVQACKAEHFTLLKKAQWHQQSCSCNCYFWHVCRQVKLDTNKL